MRKVLGLAVVCALAAAPALAAGGSKEQRSEMGGPQQQQGMSGQWQEPGGQQTSEAAQPLDESTVRQIQQQLQSQGYDVQPDGIFGPKTRQAVQQFQERQGLESSGRVDAETLAALGVPGDTQQAETPREQQERMGQPETRREQERQEQPGGMTR